MLEFLLSISWIIITYFLIANLFYIFFYISAAVVIWTKQKAINSVKLELLYKAENLPSIAIVVPSYNEESCIVFCVESLLRLPYPNKKIIIVNDGSKDESMTLLNNVFALTPVHAAYTGLIPCAHIKAVYVSENNPNLFIIDKENGGRADALNAGLNICDSDYFLTIDADTLIDELEIVRLLRYMLTEPAIRGFGASLRVANGCDIATRGVSKARIPTNWFAACQSVEYLRAFLIGRTGWDFLGGPLILSGAFSFFQTKPIQMLKGFDADSIGEDMELTVRMKRTMMDMKRNSRTEFIPAPVAWTEVPSEYKDLSNQRTRWSIGCCQVIWRHKRTIFNPRYGWFGMVQMPYYLFYEMLSPIMELLGYLTIILIFASNRDSFPAFLFLLVSIGFTTALNIACILIEVLAFRSYSDNRSILKLLFYSLAENVGYRQLNLIWRLVGLIKWTFGYTSWGIVKKKGFHDIQGPS